MALDIRALVSASRDLQTRDPKPRCENVCASVTSRCPCSTPLAPRRRIRVRVKLAEVVLADPWSTGWQFEGWEEGPARDRERFPDGYEHLVVGEATSWLLRTGWRKYGLVSMFEKPSAGVFVRRMAQRDSQRWRQVDRDRQCE